MSRDWSKLNAFFSDNASDANIEKGAIFSDSEQPQFGMMKFRRSGKSSDLNPNDPDNPHNPGFEISSKEIKPNGNIPNGHGPGAIPGASQAEQEKFAPMAIGNARSSSRNSFVMK